MLKEGSSMIRTGINGLYRIRQYSTLGELLAVSRKPPSVSSQQRISRPATPLQITKPTISTPPPKPAPLNRPKRDEEIDSNYITFVDAEGQVHGRQRLSQVLTSFDRSQYFLVQVDPLAKPPVCRLFDKKTLFEKEKSKKRGKQTSPESVTKEIMFGWNVSPHDMDHKLNKACQFLEKGNKVKIEINHKKGQNRITKDAQQEVIQSVIDALNSYKLVKKPVLNGHTCIMQFERK
ncbi:unnamed protein product [Rhizopus microsporus]